MPAKQKASSKSAPLYLYGNELDCPIDWRLKALVRQLRNDSTDEPDWELRSELLRRFGLLFDHYGISRDAPDAHQRLATALAFNHVAGFSLVPVDKRRRGAPSEVWRHAILGAVDAMKAKFEKLSVLRICEKLSEQDGLFKGLKANTMERGYKTAKKNAEEFKTARQRLADLLAQPVEPLQPVLGAMGGGLGFPGTGAKIRDE